MGPDVDIILAPNRAMGMGLSGCREMRLKSAGELYFP